MKRILFVDDETALLDALRARLRRRREWDMVFLENGPRAVAEMELSPVDLLVVDMRMPKMDGAELLAVVRERWPRTIRVVLSGYTEQEQSTRVLSLAHHYLSKPCDTRQLESSIERLLRAEHLLPSAELRALVAGCGGLPVNSRVRDKLRKLLSSSEVSPDAIAALVRESPSIAAKVMHVARSAFFRLPRRVEGIQQAVVHLGAPALRMLLDAEDAFPAWPASDVVPGLSPQRLRHRAVCVGVAAKVLAAGTDYAEAAELAGLLHNIGHWVLLHLCPQRLQAAVRLALDTGTPLYRAEREVLGASHAEVGAYLLSLWGLPSEVIEAVAHQHAPERILQDRFGVLGALVTAASLCSDAASELLACDAHVDNDSLRAWRAPFDLAEARKRIHQFSESVSP